MKRTDLIRKLTAASRSAGVDFTEIREGGGHSIYRCGTQPIAIPRHREINEHTAEAIMKKVESQLGKGWWR